MKAKKTYKKGGKFPDLTGDGKVTRADVLKGRGVFKACLLYTSPSPRDGLLSRMPSSA